MSQLEVLWAAWTASWFAWAARRHWLGKFLTLAALLAAGWGIWGLH